jgi:hypothetical protein
MKTILNILRDRASCPCRLLTGTSGIEYTSQDPGGAALWRDADALQFFGGQAK